LEPADALAVALPFVRGAIPPRLTSGEHRDALALAVSLPDPFDDAWAAEPARCLRLDFVATASGADLSNLVHGTRVLGT
jgi:hypothetical protein